MSCIVSWVAAVGQSSHWHARRATIEAAPEPRDLGRKFMEGFDMGMWKVIGAMAGLCALFIFLLIGLSIGGLKI